MRIVEWRGKKTSQEKGENGTHKRVSREETIWADVLQCVGKQETNKKNLRIKIIRFGKGNHQQWIYWRTKPEEWSFKNVIIYLPDTREEIKDAYDYSLCCIGLVTGKFKDNCYYSTGFLVGPRMVLTCASILYDRTYEMVSSELMFSVGVNGNQGESIKVKESYFPSAYKTETENSKMQYNIGLVELERDI